MVINFTGVSGKKWVMKRSLLSLIFKIGGVGMTRKKRSEFEKRDVSSQSYSRTISLQRLKNNLSKAKPISYMDDGLENVYIY